MHKLLVLRAVEELVTPVEHLFGLPHVYPLELVLTLVLTLARRHLGDDRVDSSLKGHRALPPPLAVRVLSLGEPLLRARVPKRSRGAWVAAPLPQRADGVAPRRAHVAVKHRTNATQDLLGGPHR